MRQAAVLKRELLEQLIEQEEFIYVEGVYSCFPYLPAYPLPEQAQVRKEMNGITYTRHCESSFACPVCTPQFMARRREDCALLMKDWKLRGGFFYFQTLTQRTSPEVETGALYRGLVDTWHAMRNRSKYASAFRAAGAPEYVKVIEETLSESGWHVHFHVLWFFPATASKEAAEAFLGAVNGLWANLSTKYTPLGAEASCQDWKPVTDNTPNFSETMTEYLFKNAFYNILDTEADLLTKRKWQPFELLRLLFMTGDTRFGNAWIDYQKGSYGRRRVCLSKGLTQILPEIQSLTSAS